MDTLEPHVSTTIQAHHRSSCSKEVFYLSVLRRLCIWGGRPLRQPPVSAFVVLRSVASGRPCEPFLFNEPLSNPLLLYLFIRPTLPHYSFNFYFWFVATACCTCPVPYFLIPSLRTLSTRDKIQIGNLEQPSLLYCGMFYRSTLPSSIVHRPPPFVLDRFSCATLPCLIVHPVPAFLLLSIRPVLLRDTPPLVAEHSFRFVTTA